MSSARDEILDRIRAAKDGPEETAVPREYRRTDTRPHDELVALFAERVADYKAKVEMVEPARLSDAISGAAFRHSARTVVVPPQVPIEWRPIRLELLADTALTRRQLDQIDCVITGCTVAIAETGTIVLSAAPHEGRRALSLVPDLHICVVHEQQIVGGLPQAISQLAEIAHNERRPITLISGPSATSDIELQRVEGVHGPRKLVVLVLREAPRP